jgi:diguanylate cyclase (GGDEF)-like protein/PAS domain S-box-containing protein
LVHQAGIEKQYKVKTSAQVSMDQASASPLGGQGACCDPLSETLFKAIFNQSSEAIALTRLSDDVLVEVNREWIGLFGFQRQNILGKTAVEIGHWESQAARESVLGGLQAGVRVTDEDVTLLTHEGLPRLVRMNAAVVEVAGESYVLLYLRDVTAERMAQEALRAGERVLEETNEKLNRQLKLHASTESVAKVGHWLTFPGEQVVHISPGYADIFRCGDTAEVPLGEHIKGIPDEDRAIFIEALLAMDGRTIECRWKAPDGSLIWFRTRMYRQLEHGLEKANFGIVQEITAERAALEAVSRQLEFIQRITSRAPGMVYEFQMWPDGRMQFLFISEGAEALMNVNRQAMIADSMEFFSRIERSDRARLQKIAAEGTRTLSPWQCEMRTDIAGIAQRWLLVNAVPQAQSDGSVLWCGSVTDITLQKEALLRLQESEARFRDLTELSSDWYWEQDAQFRFLRVDGNLENSNALPPDNYIGKTRWDSGAQGVSEQGWAAHKAQVEAHLPFRGFEMQRLRSDGSFMWVSISGAPIFDSNGVFKGYRGTGTDISDRKRAEADIERLAFYDALTGLPNRRLLIDRLHQALEFSSRRITHGALLFIDLDNFKVLNDTSGHHMGDELLKQVAERLAQCVRSTDTVARLGGDEFVVMLEDIGEGPEEAGAQAELVGRKVLAALNQEYALDGQRHHSSPSIGVTLFFQHLHSLEELLKRADLAMYQAKAAGRNTLRFYDPEMQAAATARAALEVDIRESLQRDEFVLYYQPVVDENEVTSGVEALLRWKHPVRGQVSPAEFIPVAEQTGLILQLGQWVMNKACVQLANWARDPCTSDLTIAVNVSARQFRQPEFTSQVKELLRVSGAAPQRLKLELTESLLLSDVDDAIRKMEELQSVGVRFALDDFGTGYSSLSYLKRLPLDQLKIDQSFVRDVLVDPNDAAIARTILNLAQSLDLGVVAEGVETQGQFDFLLQSGCKAFQGYLFGRPVPVEQLKLPGKSAG